MDYHAVPATPTDGVHQAARVMAARTAFQAVEQDQARRIGQAVDNTPVGAEAQSFAHALHVSVLVPVVRSLRRLADWLDPAPAPMRNHRVPA